MVTARETDRASITAALAMAEQYLLAAPLALSFADNDPLHIQLPPLLESGPVPEITADALRGLAAMYLQAELEQAGVILAAELLAGARERLMIRSAPAARKLEEFARRQRDWYTRRQREALLARVFGIGGSAAGGRDDTVNHDFQRVFANLCYAIVRAVEDLNWRKAPNPSEDARLRQSATAMVLNVASRQYGNTLLAGKTIGEQLRAAVDVLSEPGIGTHFMANGMWDVLRKIYGDLTPDLGRLVARGQAGMRVLSWVGVVLPGLLDAARPRQLVNIGDPVALAAARWLDATGLPVNTGRGLPN